MTTKATEEREINAGIAQRQSSLLGGHLAEGDREEMRRTGPDPKIRELFFELLGPNLVLWQEQNAR